MLLFGFACLLAYFYVASSNLLFLLDGRTAPRWSLVLKLGTLAIVFLGGIVPAETIWTLGDIGLGLITWVNLACLVLLAPLVYKVYRDYERQRRQGLDPVFNPRALGIKGADFWETGDKVEAGTASRSRA